jgi:hypothetical protein
MTPRPWFSIRSPIPSAGEAQKIPSLRIPRTTPRPWFSIRSPIPSTGEAKKIPSLTKNPKKMRPNPETPLIGETDARKRAVGASLVQEITAEGGSKEKVWIYAASRTLESVETRYSTIRKELLAVVFAVQNFRRLLIGRFS